MDWESESRVRQGLIYSGASVYRTGDSFLTYRVRCISDPKPNSLNESVLCRGPSGTMSKNVVYRFFG